MKKLMSSAFACVAFAFSGFASNEVILVNQVFKDKPEANCNFTITTTKNGKTTTREYTNVNPYPYKDCEAAVKSINKKFEEAGLQKN